MDLLTGLTLPQIALLSFAAFFAGALNAVAGGGSFLTLPALAYVGVPLVSANATGTAALLPGYVSGTWAFRNELRPPAAMSFLTLSLWSLAGGAAGAALLVATSNAAFGKLVPWLLLTATLLFAFGGPVVEHLRAGRTTQAAPSAWAARLTVFAVAVYGGYFNGGLGILLLAAFALLGESDLNTMNGNKNLVSSLLTLIAVLLYAANSAVVWPYALMMMAASTLGGYAGGRAARRLPATAVRAIVILTGAAMTLIFYLRSR